MGGRSGAASMLRPRGPLALKLSQSACEVSSVSVSITVEIVSSLRLLFYQYDMILSG